MCRDILKSKVLKEQVVKAIYGSNGGGIEPPKMSTRVALPPKLTPLIKNNGQSLNDVILVISGLDGCSKQAVRALHATFVVQAFTKSDAFR